MIEYLDLDDLLDVALRAVGTDVAVRDYGLLASALARPRASAFGAEVYPDLHQRLPRCCIPWHVTMLWWTGTNGSPGRRA